MSIVRELIVCDGVCGLLVLRVSVRRVEDPLLAATICDDGQTEVILRLGSGLA